MKKLITVILLLIASAATYGQGCFYSQNFENPVTGITSTGTPGFVAYTPLFHDGVQSYRGTYDPTTEILLTSDDFDLTGQTYVILKFWHICKLEFFDQGLIEVSDDGGANWTQLTGTEYLVPDTISNFATQGNKFTEAAYTAWHPGDTVTQADSSWWREEQFDVSALLGTGSVTNAKIRFKGKDLNLNGMNGRQGWFIDEICVLAAPCELTDPVFIHTPPILQGTVYSLGPYTINAIAYDTSGIAGLYLFYSVNGAPQPTIPMYPPLPDSNYTCQIPAVVEGDTVCYSFYVFDASCNANDLYYPDPLGIGQICFVASRGELLPYCDNFDTAFIWIDSLVSGSAWELGTPNFGVTNTPHSAPNSWDISLNTGYVSGTEAYLISPVIDFVPTTNATMKFWYNCDTDPNNQDGVRLETSVGSSPWAVLTTASDPTAVNWYNVPSLASSGTPGWGGSSNGWTEAKFNMSTFNNAGGVQLRFVFTSSAFNPGDGFSIDDICITLPPAVDMGVDKVIEPFPIAGGATTSNAIVRVRNFGSAIQSAFDVYYTTGGPVIGPIAYTGPPLAPNDTAIITMPTFLVPNGPYDFCAWTVIPADADGSNDTSCVQRTGIPVVPVTYCNNFDVSGGDWTSIPAPIGNTQWELGTPAFGVTNSAFSAPNSWDINLTTAYDNDAVAILLSPFFDFTTAANVDLTFWRNHECELNWDGTRIEYSVNASPWQVLGAINQGINWYTNILNSSGLPGWDGNSNGWVKSTLNVSQFNNIGLVQLQYVFTSDGLFNGDGFSIDNFCLREPQPIDVGVDSIISPTVNSGAGQNTDVIVRVRNFGLTPQSTFDLVYVFDDGVNIFTSPPIAYSGPTLNPNDTYIDTIPPQITIPNGLFTVCAYTSLSTDQDHTNDTICKLCKGIPVLPVSYCENFDGVNNDWTPVLITGTSQWELGTPNFGSTNSAHSAPNSWDVNLNNGYTAGSNCELLSPFFDLTIAVNAQLNFWQNRNTQAFNDGARLDIFDGNQWSTLGTLNDPLATNWYSIANIPVSGQPAWDGNSNGWKKSTYQLVNYNNSGLIQLKYVFRSANFSTGTGFSIDDFCITIPPPQDAGAVSIVSPTGGLVIGNSYAPIVTIKNFGSTPIDSIPVTYTINGSVIATEIYLPQLLPNGTGTHPFLTSFTALTGAFDICAYTGLSADGDHTNDTTCRQLIGVPTFTPTYTDDFDGVNNGWTTTATNPAALWELGTPSVGATNSTHSAPNCWDINLTTQYTVNASCELISPFFDFIPVVDAEISFWTNYNTQLNQDGVRLDYSDDGGTSWNTLGDLLGVDCQNWYNNNLTATNQPGWSGNSGGWIFCRDSNLIFLNNNPLPVIFKFIFSSNAFGISDGSSIDDFLLYVPITVSAATDSVYPVNNILTPGPQAIMGRYINKGTTALSQVLLSLRIDGNLIVTDTINPIPGGPLPKGAPKWHTFSALWTASPGLHTICIYTSQPNGTADLNTSDDTSCTVVTVFDSTSIYPYCTDFESGPQWVALNSVNYTPVSSWQIGTPIKTNLIGAHSGANCWVTNLVSHYPSEDNSSLFSPVFNVQAGKCYELSFWHNADMDLFNDGGTVEYTLDSGKTWAQLGDGGDYLNWFNSAYIAAFGGPPAHAGWTGTFGGWLQSKHNWSGTQTGQVIFRWRFASDFTNEADGWSIDDVCFIEIAGPCITAIGGVTTNGFYLYQNAPNPANEKTSIAFSLPERGKAEMTVTNLAGQVIARPVNETLGEGRHSVDLNSKDFVPGIYYYTLNFDGRKIVRKMVIIE